MPLPSNWFYKDGGYWAPDGSGPYVMTDAGVMQLVGSGSGSTYLGPMTWAELQASAYADGSVGLAALGADASVFVTDRRIVMIPSAAKTFWTIGFSGEPHSVADLAARQTAGDPVPKSTLLIDPTSGLVYGQSDGAGGYASLIEPYALSELTPYVTLAASGIAFTGACELAGWYCSVAAGNITVYDALSATGTPIVPATTLAAGPMPIFGAGTTGKLALTTGCYVVLSDAATVRVLVGEA